MTGPEEAVPQARSAFLSPLSILILLGIASRIFLLNWYRGEYTDGIIQLQLFENQNTYFPPLYPLLAGWMERLVGHPVLAGRLVSLLASTLVLVPLYHLARRLFSERAAVWAGVFYLAAAVPNRWALRVMSDSLFTFFFLLALMAFVFSLAEPQGASIASLPRKMSKQLTLALSRARLRRWFYVLAVAAGLATLTRYQGLALLPLVAVSFYRNRRGYTKWELVETALCLLPWLALAYWIRVRGFGHPGQFTGRVHGTPGQTLLAYWDMAETFMLYLPYAMTLPVFALMAAGFFSSGGSPLLRATRWTLVYLLILWLGVHAAFQSFQYRYFLPLVPLLIVFAGEGMAALEGCFRQKRWRGAMGLGFCAVALSLAFSAAVLFFQRDAFADFTEVGQWVAGGNFRGGKVFATEVYNPGNTNLKLSFWAGKPVEFLDSLDGPALQAGDYLVLSNVYNAPLERVHAVLSSRYEFEMAAQTQHYRLIPLLPDIMVYPPGATSQPLCMAYRFHPQEYYSYVIRITGVRG